MDPAQAPQSPGGAVYRLDRGCPYDCGLCPDHRQQSCCILLEVTPRCDLGCPVCFADAGSRATAGRAAPDPDLAIIEGWYRRLLDAGGPFNVQLSGGEPCLRDDLPQIIALGRSLGFTFFQLNTNGLRLARDLDYLRRLVDAGLSTVFLQFDGTRDAIHARLRGRALADQKQAAIENCIEQGVGVVLVPTLVPGVNVDDIGAIIEFALQRAPAVRGVHFQPISYFGRYPAAPLDSDRITIPEVIRAIETQTHGAIRRESFLPPGGENALCSFHGNFVLMPDGKLVPLTSRAGEKSCCSAPEPAREGAAKSREFVALHWAAPPQPTPESRPDLWNLLPPQPRAGHQPGRVGHVSGARQDPHLLYLGYGVPGRLDVGSGPPAGLLHPCGERSRCRLPAGALLRLQPDRTLRPLAVSLRGR